MIALEALNALPPAQFVAHLGGIFEHSPWVAQRAAEARPFGSRLQLLEGMRGVVRAAGAHEQLALIRAHPQLGAGRAAPAALTEASAREQRRAGLDGCTPAQLARLRELNAAYLDKFGFPFVLAVRGHDPASIIARCQQRLGQPAGLEQHTALAEIELIAGYRLADVVATSAAVEMLAMKELLRHAASPDRDGAGRHSLVRTWMLAAGLELVLDSAGCLLGYAPGAGSDAAILLLGVHYDASAGEVHYQGALGFIAAIAVLQQLRQQRMRVPSALAIMARPNDLQAAVVTAATIAASLRAAGLRQDRLVIAREGPRPQASIDDTPDALAAENATAALRELLLQTQGLVHYNGCAAHE